MNAQTNTLSPETFWQLLGRYRVKIPLLQRDYAQGRQDPTIDQLRREFVANIVAALKPSGTATLDLGLVYGTTHEETAPPHLLLLDGQQRLTTIFLVHWFLAWRSIRSTDRVAAFQMLGRFTYETRATARDFCLALTGPGADLDGKSAVNAIEDAPWFFSTWREDPTVRAMLVTLNEIERQFEEVVNAGTASATWKRLTVEDSAPVFFRFLPMSDYRLTDDLYLKMNSRGRPLTDFEKFKAWLERHIGGVFTEAERRALSEDGPWEEELDRSWTDFFWHHSGRNPKKMHADYLRFLKAVALNHLAATSSDAENVKRLFDEVSGDGFIPTTSLERLFTFEPVRDTFRVLRKLGKKALEKVGERSLYEDFLTVAPNYKRRVEFHALCRFFTEGEEPYDVGACRRWMRVIWYLTENSPIENPESFRRAVTSIHEIAAEASGDIHRWLMTLPKPSLVGFLGYQVAEEKRKAGLIRAGLRSDEATPPAAGEGWESALADAEDHPFFNGQITFLLDHCLDESGSENIRRFRVAADKARRVFNNATDGGMLWRGEFLVERALLALGDYLMHLGGDTYRLGGGPEEWRSKVFRDARKVQMVHQLLRELTPEAEEDSLRRIIDSAIGRSWPQDDAKNWSRALIECPELFSFCEQQNIRYWWGGRYFLLLKQKRTSAPYRELRIHRFYVKHLAHSGETFRPFKVGYDADGDSDNHHLPFPRLDQQDYTINIRYLLEEQSSSGRYRLDFIKKDQQPFPAEFQQFADMHKPAHDLTRLSAGRIHFHYGDETTTLEALHRLVDRIRGQIGN
ncbi:MAG: DUF262 domain-containing protein [Rhodospirillales bacterium]|nr:DUF262 domain-containing protein [Acetobacter sp.]